MDLPGYLDKSGRGCDQIDIADYWYTNVNDYGITPRQACCTFGGGRDYML